MIKQLADPATADPGLTLMNVELVLRASTGTDAMAPDQASLSAAAPTVPAAAHAETAAHH